MNIRQTSKLTSTESYSEILKNNFFYVMFLIVQGNQTSKFFVLFSNIFIFCQYCYLNFGLKIKYIWQNHTVEILNLLLKYFTITINVKNIGFINYLYVFYASLGVILLSIIIILLLIFVFKTQRSQQIPIFILRLLLKFILTFGYWPIIRMQFGLLACQYNKAGKYVMMFETKQECWTSNYTLHAIIAICGLTFTIIFTSTIQYFAYQKRLNKFNTLAMQNSNSQVTLLLYIFIQILVYQMTPTPKYTFLILLVYLIGSGFYFMMTHVQKPFCHEFVQKLMSILSTVNLWVIIMMIYAYFLEGKYFNYNLTLLLISIPFIIGIILMKDSQKYQIILSDISSKKNGITVINLCSYLLHLLENSEKNQRAQLILQNFIVIHKEICLRSDCYAKKQAVNFVETNQKHYIIHHLINQIYVDALQNHPEDIDLRLYYIFFLIDHRHQYSQALSEIFIAEQFCQSYDQQFQLYLNKKNIQQYLADAKNTIKYDKFADVSFSKQEKEFYALIETTTHLYIDFWTQLQEEVINISLTLQIAYQLINQKKQIEKQYQSIVNQNRRAIQIKRLYHGYLQTVANQQPKNDQLILQDEKQENFLNEQLEDICNQSNPMAIISAHSNQEPKFINVNKSFCRFVCYTKSDLINLPLNNIIPESYSQKHTQCIENFLNHKVTQVRSQMVKSKIVYVKQKNKYIIQSYVDVKLIEAHHNELILVAQFQPQFQIKNTCHIIISQDGYLLDITSNCIPLLGIDVEQIQQQQYNINEIFPDFFINKNQLMRKNGSVLVFQNQNGSLKKSIRSRSSTFFKKINQKFNCQIKNIEFPCIQEEVFGPQNILVQLDLISPKHSKDLNNLQLQTINVKKRQKIGLFKFCIKSTIYKMNQIYVDDLDANDNQIILNHNLSKLIGIAGCLKMSRKLKTQTIRIQNYGEDIRTCRLVENKIIDINDIEENDDDFASDLENEIKENQLQNQLLIQLSQETLNSAQLKENKLQEYLQDPPIPLKQKIYIRIVNVFFLAFLIFQILSYSLTNQYESQILDNISIISAVNQRMSNVFMIQSILQDIRFFYKKYYYENNITKVFNQQINLLNLEIQQIQKIHNSLSQIQIQSSQQYQQWTDSYYSRNVQMMDYLGNYENYSFKEAIDQLISKAILLNNSNIDNFDYHKADYFYYIYNSFNTIIWNGGIAEMYYQSLVLTILDQSQNLNTLLFVLNTIFIPFLSLIIIFFLMQVHQDIDEIINLLIEFEENQLQKLQQQCESFLNIVFFDDCDDIKSQEPDEKVQSLQYNNVINKKKKRINSKNSIFSQKKIIIQIGVISILISFYFTYYYLDNKTVLENYYELLPILNQTSIIENYFRLQDNIIREAAINPNITFLNTPNKTTFIFGFFDTLYEVNGNLFELINQHTQYLQDKFQQQFYQIYLFNPCTLINVNKTECQNFSNGILLLGQSAANIKYIEDLRIMNYEFLNYSKNQVQIQLCDIEQAIKKLLNSDRAKNVRKMQQIYLRKQQIYLIQALESSITESFNMLQMRKGIYLGFLILILIFIFSLWIPLQQQQIQQLRKTKKILQLFPFEILIKSNSAVNYFKNLKVW